MLAECCAGPLQRPAAMMLPSDQSFTVLSPLPEAISVPSGEKSTARTGGIWASSSCSCLPSATSQILTLPSLSPDTPETRLALVVGQNDYRNLSKLNNPVPDATAIAAALRAHGFEVTELHDLPRAEFLDALEAFRVQSEPRRWLSSTTPAMC
jgi:caspase domain-containing protein